MPLPTRLFFTNNLPVLLAVLVLFSPVKLGAVVQFRHQQLPVSDFPDKIVFYYVLNPASVSPLLVKNTNKGGDFLTHIDESPKDSVL